jgi:hypothetical protein
MEADSVVASVLDLDSAYFPVRDEGAYDVAYCHWRKVLFAQRSKEGFFNEVSESLMNVEPTFYS